MHTTQHKQHNTHKRYVIQPPLFRGGPWSICRRRLLAPTRYNTVQHNTTRNATWHTAIYAIAISFTHLYLEEGRADSAAAAFRVANGADTGQHITTRHNMTHTTQHTQRNTHKRYLIHPPLFRGGSCSCCCRHSCRKRFQH
jgi:hypothetical protein